jgi:hypothetical protein
VFGAVSVVICIFFAIIWITAGPLSPYSVYAIGGTSLPAIFFWLLGIVILLLGIPMYYYGKRQNMRK